MSVREMLRQLAHQGFEIAILGATNFDHPRGQLRLAELLPEWQNAAGVFVDVRDDPLAHRLVKTASTKRHEMTSHEAGVWYIQYKGLLDTWKPDLVFYYGGLVTEFIVGIEARARGIPVVVYVGNGTYTGARWCRDVDLIITDSRATAAMYAEKQSLKMTPVGKFVHPGTVVAASHTRERILFVNPSAEKGVNIVAMVALLMEARRPDIQFEVVESRGSWHEHLGAVSRHLGKPRESLQNVTVTPHTNDMRPIYARARLLLMPSLWWESYGRVLVEAMMNGIPALITNRGGMPEGIENAGIILQLPAACYEPPYVKIPGTEILTSIVDTLIRIYDDQPFYDDLVAKAHRVGNRDLLKESTQRLIQAITPLLEKRAGDQDFEALLKQGHRQGLAS